MIKDGDVIAQLSERPGAGRAYARIRARNGNIPPVRHHDTFHTLWPPDAEDDAL
jgi:hypothetical protein